MRTPSDIDATNGFHLARPGRIRLISRAIFIAIASAIYLLPSSITALFVWTSSGRKNVRRYFYRSLVRLLQRLGPTFVKAGQIMSTRRDALPSALCEELAVLHDRVRPMSTKEIRQALEKAYRKGSKTLFQQKQLEVVASGSIATVFRATMPDGKPVAVKLQRPDIAPRMIADLALLEVLVRLAEHLPKCEGMPLGDLTAYVSTAILGQLDFVREAANLSRIRDGLSIIPGIRVPSIIFEACRPGCLVMEFIPGLDSKNVKAYPPMWRKRFAQTALLAVRHMIFVDGFVHCDLHPGNLYISCDGEIIILDAGFSVQLSDRVRQLMAEFFAALAGGNGCRCAEIIIESAANKRHDTNLKGFIDAVVKLVNVYNGPSAANFELMRFGDALFDLQRKFGLYAESDFAFPLMSLAVVENTVKSLSSELDLQELGRLDISRYTSLTTNAIPSSRQPEPTISQIGAVSTSLKESYLN